MNAEAWCRVVHHRPLVLAGLVVFTMLGVVLALALALLDDRIYRRGDLDQLIGVPVLAAIPRDRRRRFKAAA